MCQKNFELSFFIGFFRVGFEGRAKIQTVLPPHTDCGLFIWASSRFRFGKIVHGPCFTDNLKAIPKSQRGNFFTNKSHEEEHGWRGQLWNRGWGLKIEICRSTATATTGASTVRNVTTQCLETPERITWTSCFCSTCLALRPLSTPVSVCRS